MSIAEFFNAQAIAVIGASRDEKKIGHIILKNLLKSNRNIFPINPNAESILGKKCYKNINDVVEKIELAVIAVPNINVPQVLEDCGKKEVRSAVIITSGFREAGNEELENQIFEIIKKYEIRAIGPNCLGIIDFHSGLDTLFIKEEKLKRPSKGNVSVITQSGALGAVILDLANDENIGISKFISYGNAVDVNESDAISFLAEDETTNAIFLYIESIKNGKEFIDAVKKCKKPIVIFKGGKTEPGSRAVMSHTGSLAGEFQVYKSVFRQFDLIHVETLEEAINCLKLFNRLSNFRGKRIQVITNGGGFGILASDAVIKNNLQIAHIRKKSAEELMQFLPTIASIKNPIDLLGDATNEQYDKSIEVCANDKNVDILLVIVLPQTPFIKEEGLSGVISKYTEKKPIIAVIPGGEKTRQLRESFEKKGIVVYNFPEEACRAISMLTEFYAR